MAPVPATWTSGALNTYNKVSFPTAGHTQVYVQIKAQMMGDAGSDDKARGTHFGSSGKATKIARSISKNRHLRSRAQHGLRTSPVAPNLVADEASPSDLSAGYHLYGMQLDTATGMVSFYLDNVLVGSAAVDQPGPYFLLLVGAIASGLYDAAPAVNAAMQMNVAEVQVYQR